jgi:hypothetical protein
MLILSFATYMFSLIAGVPTFKVLSPIMVYSVCVYALVNTTAYFAVTYKIIPFFKNDDELENLVYVAMLILFVLNSVCVPVFMWLDAPKVVQYFEDWKKFQVCTDVAISLQMQTWLASQVRHGKGGENYQATVYTAETLSFLVNPLVPFPFSGVLTPLSVT